MVQGASPNAPPPVTPAVATHAQPHRYSMDQQPSYTGGTVTRNAVATVPGAESPQPKTTAAHAAAAPRREACGVCSSADVQFVLEQHLGVDAADVGDGSATSTRVRSPFCSIECLGSRLGLVPAAAEVVDVGDNGAVSHVHS